MPPELARWPNGPPMRGFAIGWQLKKDREAGPLSKLRSGPGIAQVARLEDSRGLHSPDRRWRSPDNRLN
jgi:hypothetical protein